jgi:PAS domain-containing protein
LVAVDHLGVRRFRTSFAVTFPQPRFLLSLALVTAVLLYMSRHAKGLADCVLVSGTAGLLVLLLAPPLRARRIARSAAAEEHSRFEGMFMDAAIGMALTDAEGRWVRANPALTTMLGYREDELMGRPFTEITHPDDRGDGVRHV